MATAVGDNFDLDRAMEIAWVSFQARLADHLRTLTDSIELAQLEGDGGMPHDQTVTIVRSGEGSLRATIDPALGEGQLRSLGWTPEAADAPYSIESSLTDADLLAAVVVQTLREVLGVAHPAFLQAGPLTISSPAQPEVGEPEPVPEIDLDAPVPPETPGQLRTAVDAILHAALRHRPRYDPDGDIPIAFGSTLVFVRVDDSAPVVQIFAIASHDIRDLDAARREVEILNRRSLFIRYGLYGNQLLASTAVLATPLVPRHLLQLIEMVGREVDAMDEDLALRVSGRRRTDGPTAPHEPDEPEPQAAPEQEAAPGPQATDTDDGLLDPEQLPEELVTLRRLSTEAEGPVDPAIVAHACHTDRELIIRLIRTTEDQTLAWRTAMNQARRGGDIERARACAAEMHGWEATLRDLRAGLRHVVTYRRRAI